MDYLVTATGLITVAAYVWSLRKHFVSGEMPSGARVVSLTVATTTVLYVLLVLLAPQPLWAQIIGFVLQLCGGALFATAISASRNAALNYAFTTEKPRGLVETGPYRYIRHPFYTSYIVFFSGWALACWSPYALITLVLLVVFYVIAARAEEQKFTTTPMAEAYADYKKRTGFFWPKFF